MTRYKCDIILEREDYGRISFESALHDNRAGALDAILDILDDNLPEVIADVKCLRSLCMNILDIPVSEYVHVSWKHEDKARRLHARLLSVEEPNIFEDC